MRKARKLIAGVLTLAMAVPLFAACGKKNGDDVIQASDPWYDVASVSFGKELDPAEYEYAYMDFVGVCDEGYVYRLEAVRLIPEGFNYETDDIMDLYESNLVVFDNQGNEVSNVAVTDYLRSSYFNGMASLGGIRKSGDNWLIQIDEYDSETGAQKVYNATVDLMSGEIGEPVEGEVPDEIAAAINEGASEESSAYIGEYEIRKFWISGDTPSYIISVTDGSGNTTVFDLRELFPNEIVFDIRNFIDMGNNKALINATDYTNDKFFILDFSTMQITMVDSGMEWLSNDLDNISSVEGIGSAIINDDGVYAVDFDAQTIEPLFLFSDTNVNQYDISNFTPVKITEEECVFTGTSSLPSRGSSANISTSALIYTFTRADSNPNAGKTIIEVASVEDFSYALCNAVCEFNNTSSEYFIKLISKYNLDKFNTADAEDDQMAAHDNASATLSNQLAIDLMAGEGPDVIINAASLNMLNNSDYLLDMSEYVQQNFGEDQYFTNLFEARKTNGALYQIPLSVSVVGINTSADNVADGQEGFTFEQYEQFVAGPCNGQSPFSGNRVDVFIQLADCMQDSFIVDGQVNFDTPEFRALAEFTRDNINDSLEADGYDYYSQNSDVVSVEYISDISRYFDNIASKNNVLLGLPSSDGRGPVIYESDSVAISALTSYPDACREFVNVLLGESSQDIYAAYEIPVNRVSLNNVATEIIEAHNNEINLMLRLYDETMLTSFGYSVQMMDESDIPEFEEFVGGIDTCYVNDASINSIIREEIPSFFEGQKSLDQIIPVLNDRVSTVLEERN